MAYESHPPGSSPAAAPDALQILSADHEAIRALFAEYALYAQQPTGAADRHGVIARLGALLRAHDRIEAELFLPALEGRADAGMLGHALADHAEISQQLQHVAAIAPDDPGFDEHFAALAGKVHAHLFEAERSLFPHAAGLDLVALGERITQRRGELLADQGAVD